MAFDSPAHSPGYLLKSFFVVATCYLLFLGCIGGVFAFGFNEVFLAMGRLKNADFQQFLADGGDALFPRGHFLPIIIGCGAAGFIAGVLATRMAPFSAATHAGFLAIVVGVTMFQCVFNVTPQLQWLFIVLVAVCPIAIIAGSRWAMPAETVSDDLPAS